MKVEQSTVYNFSFSFEGTAFNFGIPAASQSEACQKLLSALTQIVGELREALKTKPN